jgi:hypothetical protein
VLFFETLASAGFVLTFLGVMSKLATRLVGPAPTGRYRALERHAGSYVRVGPALLLVGIAGMSVLR